MTALGEAEQPPFRSILAVQLFTADGWSASFDIEARGGRGEWRATGTLSDPNGATGDLFIDGSMTFDPNLLGQPVLDDVVVVGEQVYLYGSIAPDRQITFVIIGEWSGNEPPEKLFLSDDWWRYLPQAIKDTADRAVEKVLGVTATAIDLMRACQQLAIETCFPDRPVYVRFELGPQGMICEFKCPDPVR